MISSHRPLITFLELSLVIPAERNRTDPLSILHFLEGDEHNVVLEACDGPVTSLVIQHFNLEYFPHQIENVISKKGLPTGSNLTTLTDRSASSLKPLQIFIGQNLQDNPDRLSKEEVAVLAILEQRLRPEAEKKKAA